MKTTIFKFHYKDHLVRALVLNGQAYVLGPDIMPLFGYKKQPLVDINWLLQEEVDKEFIHGVPVIGLAGISFLKQYPYIKRRKARKVFEWVKSEIMSVLEGNANLPDEVRTDSWAEEDFKNYLKEAETAEDSGVHSDSKKVVITCPLHGKTAVKVKIDTSLCSAVDALKDILMAMVVKKNGKADYVDAVKLIGKISEKVMAEAQEAALLQAEEY